MERKNRIMLLLAIGVIFCIVLITVIVLCIPKPNMPQDPKPWWEQRGKVLIVLEDERSVEKKFSYYQGDNTPYIVFNYIKNENDRTECVPKLRVYYENVEIKIYTSIVSKKQYNDNQERYDSVSSIRGMGVYRIIVHGYLSEEDAIDKENNKFSEQVEIIISDGAEK